MQQKSVLLSLTLRDEAALTFIASRYRYADYLRSNMEPEEEQTGDDGVVLVYSLTSEHAGEFLSLVKEEQDGYLPMMAGQLRHSVSRLVAEAGGNDHREVDPRIQWLKETVGECERDPAWAAALRPELTNMAEIVNRQMLASARQPKLAGSIGKHDWVVSNRTEEGYLVFVDDRPLSYRPSEEASVDLAREIIGRLIADGDYRLNDKPQGFLPPKLKRQTVVVTLPDGYNGHTMKFYADPIEVMGDTVKLRCAEPGKNNMFTWRDRATVEVALTSQLGAKDWTASADLPTPSAAVTDDLEQGKLPGKRILAIFQPQAWVDDNAIDIDGQEEVDITEKVLALPLEKIHRLADQDLAADTVLYDQALEHDGPNRVEVAEQVCEFFAVSDLSSITEERLLAERMAYRDVHSVRDSRPELAGHGAIQRDPYETISKLVEWSKQMGGWDALCWKEAAECLRDRQLQLNVQPGQKSPKPGAGSECEP